MFAERGKLESTIANKLAQAESPFEREVLNELTARGVVVVPQVGVAGYRIDIGVQDDDLPGRFICGIECDGVAYHSSETARDRDRLRQQVLEGRGWSLIRVWSTDWFKDRAGQIDRLLNFIELERSRQREEAKKAKAVRVRANVSEKAAPRLTPVHQDAIQNPYVRPAAAAYVMTHFDATFGNSDILRRRPALLKTLSFE